MSITNDRGNPQPLSGSRFPASGEVYIFFEQNRPLDGVEWWLDDPDRVDPSDPVDTAAPWDFAGRDIASGNAKPLDLGTLTPGRHLLTLKALDGLDIDIDTVEFFVDDTATPDDPPADPQPPADLVNPTGAIVISHGSSSGGDPPIIAGSPLNGSTFGPNSTVTIRFNGDDVRSLWYWIDDPTRSGSAQAFDDRTPYYYTLSNLDPGTHTLTGLASNEFGAMLTTAWFTIQE